MIRKENILTDKDSTLRNISEEVSFPLSKNDEKTIKSLIKYLDMSQDEKKAEKYGLQPGVGIAAPQIGVFKKMFAVKVILDDIEYRYALINPKLISHSVVNTYLKGGEGCLSVPTPHEGYVYRHYKIKMKAYDYLTSQEVILSLKGYVAIVVQHEYDHLSGILYYDHIDSKDPYKIDKDAIEIS